MSIENIIVHEVVKEPKVPAKLVDRPEENPIDSHAEMLVNQVTGLFRKTGMLTGEFAISNDPKMPVPKFVGLLNNHLGDDGFDDFVAFSKSATDIFIEKLNKSTSQNAGYLWFNHYVHNHDRFLSIILLRKKKGFIFDKDLDLNEVESIDLDKIHMAARINISAWHGKATRKYISFRIGSNAKTVTTYFSDFIGCEEYTQSRVDTRELREVIREYCAYHEFAPDDKAKAIQLVVDECTRCADEEVPFLLDKMSDRLDAIFDPLEKGIFLDKAQEEPRCLTNEISPDRSVFNSFSRYKGMDKRMTISFDSDLLDELAVYDRGTGALTFTEIPGDLKAQLDTATQSSESED
jgi:nucleoid-associated protein